MKDISPCRNIIHVCRTASKSSYLLVWQPQRDESIDTGTKVHNGDLTARGVQEAPDSRDTVQGQIGHLQGGGLTITNGLSRFSQPSISTIATLDVPAFLQATVDQTDEFSRKLSVYARGQVGKIDYRFSLSDPYPIMNSGTAVVAPKLNQAQFANIGHHKQYQTYLMYQFFEHEPHNTPYMTGSYLGKKKVFNIATGAIYQQNATSWYRQGVVTVYNDMLLLSLESFFTK